MNKNHKEKREEDRTLIEAKRVGAEILSKKFDPDALPEAVVYEDKKSDRIAVLTESKGDLEVWNTYRILTPNPVVRRLHYNLKDYIPGWERTGQKAVICPGEGCPICKYIFENAAAIGNQALPKPKFHFLVIDRQIQKENKKNGFKSSHPNWKNPIRILSLTIKLYKDLRIYLKDKDYGNPLDKYDIKIRKQYKGGRFPYEYSLMIGVMRPLSDGEKKLIMRYSYDLEKALPTHTINQINDWLEEAEADNAAIIENKKKSLDVINSIIDDDDNDKIDNTDDDDDDDSAISDVDDLIGDLDDEE